MPEYIPEKGDFVRLSFDPQSGYEQKGRRPALVSATPHLIFTLNLLWCVR